MYYPDHIVVTWEGEPVPIFVLDELGEPTNIATGDYLPGETQAFESYCRVVISTRSSDKVFGKDGSKIYYKYDVYMPLTDVIIPDFIADFTLTQIDGKVLNGTVKTSKNNSFNSRIWL